MKSNSTIRLSVGKADGALSHVKSFFKRADSSFQPGRTAIAWCISIAFFEMEKDMSKPLIAQVISFFTTVLFENSGTILRTELHAVRYQSMGRTASTFFIGRKTYSRRRAGILAACKNADKERCLFSNSKTEYFKGLLALQTKSSKALSLKKASTVHQTGKKSVCASSKRPVLLEEEATDFMRRPSLASYGAVRISSTLGIAVPSDSALCWPFCSRLTARMYSLSMLTIADAES